MSKHKNHPLGIRRYQNIVREQRISEEKTHMILGYLIFFINFTSLKFFTPYDKKKYIYAYEKSQIFFLLPAVYYYIISAIVESNPDKLKYSLVITILFFLKFARRFIVNNGVILTILFILLVTGFFIYHLLVIKKISTLYISEIKKRLSLLNERYNVIFDVEALKKASLRLTLWALAEQIFYINVDKVVAFLIYNGGYSTEIALQLFLVSLRLILLYISKIAESVFLRIVSIVLYVLVPFYYLFQLLYATTKQEAKNFIDTELSFVISIVLLGVEFILSLIIALLGYLDLDNFGKGISKL